MDKKNKTVKLKTQDGKELATQDGKILITQSSVHSIQTSASIALPSIDKTPTFRVPYNLMEMQSQYKEEVISEIILGIELTVAEDNHIYTMSKLLHDKSENKDEKSPDFYLGNTRTTESDSMTSFRLANNKQIITQKAPQYVVSQQEYYEAYLNQKRPGGKDIKDINKGLDSLSQKSFALKIPHPIGKNKNGEDLYDYYEGIDRLFKVAKVVRGVTEKDITKIDEGDTNLRKEKGEFIFTLHPIFRHHIQNNYVNLPRDLYERMKQAAGGYSKYITPSIIALRNYLLMQLRNIKLRKDDTATIEINNDKLYTLLKLNKYLKVRQPARARETKDKAIEVFKKIGLILNCIETIGREGQLKHILRLNKDFL